MRRYATGALVLAAASLTAGNAASAATVAFDLVGSSSQNLLAFTNFAPTFNSPGDGFGVFQRGVSSSIPFAVLDDSLSFASDSQGIVREDNTDAFFGIVDTENNDNSGPVSAEWMFDISGFSDLSLSIDMGAMGDFESSDFFLFEYSIDGGPTQTAFSSSVDEAGSQDYTLADGDTFTLNDPMLVDSLVLFNDFQTVTTGLVGSGSVLTLTLTAQFNGGEEAVAFQNIVVEGTVIPVPAPLLLLASALGAIGVVGRRRRA